MLVLQLQWLFFEIKWFTKHKLNEPGIGTPNLHIKGENVLYRKGEREGKLNQNLREWRAWMEEQNVTYGPLHLATSRASYHSHTQITINTSSDRKATDIVNHEILNN